MPAPSSQASSTMMSMSWQFTITGSGTSHGSPPWGVPEFWSNDPRDHRRRSGAMLRAADGRVILWDCGPDLAHQLTDPYKTWNRLDYPTDCVTRCDGLLLTHTHADHTHGINELRHLNRLMHGRSITMYGWDDHLTELEQNFPIVLVTVMGPIVCRSQLC